MKAPFIWYVELFYTIIIDQGRIFPHYCLTPFQEAHFPGFYHNLQGTGRFDMRNILKKLKGYLGIFSIFAVMKNYRDMHAIKTLIDNLFGIVDELCRICMNSVNNKSIIAWKQMKCLTGSLKLYSFPLKFCLAYIFMAIAVFYYIS